MSQIEIVNCAILYIESQILEVKKKILLENRFDLQLELAELELKLNALYATY